MKEMIFYALEGSINVSNLDIFQEFIPPDVVVLEHFQAQKVFKSLPPEEVVDAPIKLDQDKWEPILIGVSTDVFKKLQEAISCDVIRLHFKGDATTIIEIIDEEKIFEETFE